MLYQIKVSRKTPEFIMLLNQAEKELAEIDDEVFNESNIERIIKSHVSFDEVMKLMMERHNKKNVEFIVIDDNDTAIKNLYRFINMKKDIDALVKKYL